MASTIQATVQTGEARQATQSAAAVTAAAMMGVHDEVPPRQIGGKPPGTFERLVEMLIRPSRAQYSFSDLGPSEGSIMVGDTVRQQIRRQDYTITNGRGLRLHVSWWKMVELLPPRTIILYLHANSSSRVEAVRAGILRSAIHCGDGCELVAFDFAGSGWSEGHYVTLGYFERYDVVDVVAFVLGECQKRADKAGMRFIRPRLVLWGRSMGASTALLYAALPGAAPPSALVLDSPFRSVRAIVTEIVSRGRYGLPKIAGRAILAALRRPCQERTGGARVVDVDVVERALPGLNAREWLALGAVRRAAVGDSTVPAWETWTEAVHPLDERRPAAATARCPALLLSGTLDDFIPPHVHADTIGAAYQARPMLSLRFVGSHNSPRPLWVRDAVSIFARGLAHLTDSSAPSHALDTIAVLSAAAAELRSEADLTELRCEFALERITNDIADDLLVFSLALALWDGPPCLPSVTQLACDLATTFHLASHWHANELHALHTWGLMDDKKPLCAASQPHIPTPGFSSGDEIPNVNDPRASSAVSTPLAGGFEKS